MSDDDADAERDASPFDPPRVSRGYPLEAPERKTLENALTQVHERDQASGPPPERG